MRNFAMAALAGFIGLQAFAAESPWVRVDRLSVSTSIPSGASSNFSSAVIAIRPNKVTGIHISGIGTSNATNGLSFFVRGSIDGVQTNAFTLLTLTPSVTGTNWFQYYTNLNLGNVPFLHVANATNGATGVTNLTLKVLIEY